MHGVVGDDSSRTVSGVGSEGGKDVGGSGGVVVVDNDDDDDKNGDDNCCCCCCDNGEADKGKSLWQLAPEFECW